MGLIIALYIFLYFYLAKKNISLALLILIISLPSYVIRFNIFKVPFTLLESMILIIFLAWFLNDSKRQIQNIKYVFSRSLKLKKITYPYSREIILILILSFIAVFVSGLTNSAFGILKAYFIEPIMLYIVFINTVDFKSKNKKRLRPENIILALAVSALLVSCFAIVQKFTKFGMPFEWIESDRATSVFNYPNAVGLYLAPIIPLILGQFFNYLKVAKQFNKKVLISKQDFIIQTNKFILLISALVTSLLAIWFARSEGAILGVASGLFIFCLFLNKKIKIATLLIILFIIPSVYFLSINNEQIKDKLLFKDLSGTIRLIGWKETAYMLKDKYWLLGSGLSGYQKAVRPYHKEGFFFNFDSDPDFRRKIVIFDERYKQKYWQPLEIYIYPHNIFLNFWVELGFFGMIVFSWLFLKYIYDALFLSRALECRENKFLLLGFAGGMIALIVHGLVDVPYFKNDLACLFWVFVALLGVVKINYEKNSITKIYS